MEKDNLNSLNSILQNKELENYTDKFLGSTKPNDMFNEKQFSEYLNNNKVSKYLDNTYISSLICQSEGIFFV